MAAYHCLRYKPSILVLRTQPVTEIRTRFASLPLSLADWLEILGTSNSWSTKGQSRPVYGLHFTQNPSEEEDNENP